MRRSVRAIGLLPASVAARRRARGTRAAVDAAPAVWRWRRRSPSRPWPTCVGWSRAATVALVAGFAACGAANAAHARDTRDRHAAPPCARRRRSAASRWSSLGPAGAHDPIRTRARLLEDASLRDGYVSLSVGGRRGAGCGGALARRPTGHVRLSVSGAAAATRAWRRGAPAARSRRRSRSAGRRASSTTACPTSSATWRWTARRSSGR